MPKSAEYTMRWSAEQKRYELFCRNSGDAPVLVGDDDAWYVWLDAHASFSFHGQHGSLSLQKEQRPRGRQAYWYAYRRQGKRMIKKYIGRSADLSMAHLEEAFRALAGQTHQRPEQVDTLLMPKLRPPRLHSSLLLRERLLARLDAGLERQLTLLSAPAGFGKTTLVRTWMDARGVTLPPTAWVALDAHDNDPLRFWHYLIAACQVFQHDLGETALPLLRAARQPPFGRHSREAMLTALLNELSRLSAPGILVLEDYHVITAADIHQDMCFFLEYLPATLHLILITRTDPPLPLARLRARDELVELGAVDLAFSREETRAFLRQDLPFALEGTILDRLLARTEGWGAGLRLMTLALQGQGQLEMERHLTSIDGSQRLILEYLVAEVLSAQEMPLQLFLLQTAGLGRLTASLCDAVTGRDDSALLLKRIEQANLFLTSLEGMGQWYRYHALFAEAMQHEARHRLGEQALHELSSKASRWYEQHALFDEAIEAALAAGEIERAAMLMTHLIEAQGFGQLTEFQTLHRWLGPLPDELLRQFPILSQTFAMLLLFGADHQTPALRSQLEHYLQLAESSLLAANDMPRLGEVLALRALAAGRWNEFDAALDLSRQALKLLPTSETFWRSSCLTGVAVTNILAGRLNEALPAIEEGRAIVEATGNSYAIRAALFAQGHTYLRQGRLYQAAELLQQVLATAGEDHLDRGLALVGLATLSYEWNELTTAEQEVQEAYTLSLETGNELLMILVAPAFARILHARGQTAQARVIFQRLAAHLTHPGWQREIETYRVWLALVSGDLTTLERWAASRQTGEPEGGLTEAQQEREALLLVQWLLTQRKTHEALALLNDARSQARNQARARSELEILLLMAQAYAREVSMQEAKQALTEALALAHPAGYQRIFLDEGEAMASLLKAVLPTIQEKPLAAFVRHLLRAFTSERSGSLSRPAPSLIDPLSPQELRVLRLLVAGRSNPEIARELIVSINTVKTQVKSIYRKLDVNSRLEAADVARQWQLL